MIFLFFPHDSNALRLKLGAESRTPLDLIPENMQKSKNPVAFRSPLAENIRVPKSVLQCPLFRKNAKVNKKCYTVKLPYFRKIGFLDSSNQYFFIKITLEVLQEPVKYQFFTLQNSTVEEKNFMQISKNTGRIFLIVMA